MKPISRKFLLIAALLCFFGIAPSLVFYAMGYRFDLDLKSLKKVGMLILESKPKDVVIFINTKRIAEKTPYKAKNLFPGDYQIKITKDGYQNWEKKLSVKSGEANWASHIRLFFEKPKAENLTTHLAEDFILFPMGDKIIYSIASGDDKGIWLLDLENEKSQKVFPKDNGNIATQSLQHINFPELSFSPDNKKLLFFLQKNGEKEYGISNLENGEMFFLAYFLAKKIENIKWGKEKEIIFFQNGENLYQFNLATKIASLIFTANILDYEIFNSQIFYLEKDNKKQKVFLKKSDWQNNRQKPQILAKIPQSNVMSLKMSSRKYLAFLDKDEGKLYLFKNNKQETIAEHGVKNFKWSKEGDKLLFFNESEVWFYYLSEKENPETYYPEYKLETPNLLTRLSKEINDAFFYDEEHIAFLQETVKISELDERDKRNTCEIKIEPYKNKFAFDKKGEIIYFIDKDTQNLKKMQITEK